MRHFDTIESFVDGLISDPRFVAGLDEDEQASLYRIVRDDPTFQEIWTDEYQPALKALKALDQDSRMALWDESEKEVRFALGSLDDSAAEIVIAVRAGKVSMIGGDDADNASESDLDGIIAAYLVAGADEKQRVVEVLVGKLADDLIDHAIEWSPRGHVFDIERQELRDEIVYRLRERLEDVVGEFSAMTRSNSQVRAVSA